MNATKVQVKLFVDGAGPVDPTPIVPVFHGWIKRSALPELLIDVVDYAHVHEGPSVLLVGHEADYCLDFREGRPGLVYSRKRDGAVDAQVAIAEAIRRALLACKLLESDGTLPARIGFSGREIEIRLNDRRLAPNDDVTFQELRPAAEAALAAIYGDLPFSLARRQNDPRELLTMVATAPDAPGASELARRAS